MLLCLLALPLSGGDGTPDIILPGLPMPQALQGHDDENYPMQLASGGVVQPALTARYKVLGQMQPGIRRYNMFWSGFETTPGSALPIKCPPSATAVPASAAEKAELGFHRYHCFDTSQIDTFDAVFALDRSIAAQNAGIIYSAPAFYRDPNCTGFIFGKDAIKGGCAPMDAHLDDYEDYILMLLHRFPTLRHFVVWNEVASAGWMDMSPAIPNRAGPGGSFPLTEVQFGLWVGKYANLIRRTSSAAARAGRSNSTMIWTSNDRLWERPTQRAGAVLHSGVRPFLDRLWTALKDDAVVFGTAVHPYDGGNPYDTSEFATGHHPQAYTFGSLGRVRDYARAQLRAVRGVNPDTAAGRPYTLMFASEQGWPFPNCCDDKVRSRNICYAHALASSTPGLIGVTHNYFHDNPGGSEQGGQDYGLIADNVTADLANGKGYPTFDAYTSTSPRQWERSNLHFCCSRFLVGCQHKKVYGVFDPIEVTADGLTKLHGWAWDQAAEMAGMAPINVSIELNGVFCAIGLADVLRPDIVKSWNAGSAPNADHGFAISVRLPSATPVDRARRIFTAFATPSDGRPKVMLAQSPRCICDNNVPCPCS